MIGWEHDRLKLDIGKDTFPSYLWSIYKNGYSGILRAERNNLWKEIYFDKGIPVAAKSNILKECLGRLLVEFGKLSGETCDDSLILMKGLKKKQGEALVKMGLLKEEQLPEILKFQLRVRLLELFKWKDCNFKFTSEDVSQGLSLQDTVGEIIIDGLRGRYDELKKELTPFKDNFLKRNKSFDSILADLGAKSGISYDAMTVEKIFSSGREQVILLYALLLTGALGITGQYEELSKLSEFYEKIKDKNHFEVLGLDQGCKDIDVKKSYYKLAKLYHPDLYETDPDVKIRSIANEIFCLISMAYEVLSDEKNRKEYVEQLKRGPADTDFTAASRLLLAEMEFKKGVSYLRVNNFKDAFKYFQAAVDMNPEEAEFYAYLGWAMYNAPGRSAEDAVKARELVIKAISMNTRIAMAYYFLGYMNRVEGNLDAALKEFDKALRYDPNLVEPLREIRLINLRKDKEDKEAKSKGTFRKLFGR